jgi:thiamine monophosphate synthase
VAVVRAITGADDVAASVRQLQACMQGNWKGSEPRW